jgi:hypothetical protein
MILLNYLYGIQKLQLKINILLFIVKYINYFLFIYQNLRKFEIYILIIIVERKNYLFVSMPSTKDNPYLCTRCGYETTERYRMSNHLYERTTFCPGVKNDIELTDVIKEKILLNRTYIIPNVVKEIQNKPIKTVQKIESNEFRHYFYLIREKEIVNHSENVYKFGQSKIKEYIVNLTRLFGYGKGTEIILVLKCKNSLALERLVKIAFQEKFQRHKFGTESFIGDEDDMIALIYKIHFQMVTKEKVENEIVNKAITQENS